MISQLDICIKEQLIVIDNMEASGQHTEQSGWDLSEDHPLKARAQHENVNAEKKEQFPKVTLQPSKTLQPL